jgi:hypothetical protein
VPGEGRLRVVRDDLELVQEPRVDRGPRVDVLDRRPAAHGLQEDVEAVGRRALREASRVGRSSPSSAGTVSSSRERMAFANAWPNVRPNAMASPTLFMCVDSSALAPVNFSKAKRGHLTTT